jgi:hypothetical protein
VIAVDSRAPDDGGVAAATKVGERVEVVLPHSVIHSVRWENRWPVGREGIVAISSCMNGIRAPPVGTKEFQFCPHWC